MYKLFEAKRSFRDGYSGYRITGIRYGDRQAKFTFGTSRRRRHPYRAYRQTFRNRACHGRV